jgi:Flp pilus assembly protein TadD
MKELHDQAMVLVGTAERLRRDGDTQRAAIVLQQAFEQERHAAELSATDLTFEPTRSVLHRSAASLAIECGQLREAERLIATALSGNPPDAIAEELRDLLEQVYFVHPPKSRRRPLDLPRAGSRKSRRS